LNSGWGSPNLAAPAPLSPFQPQPLGAAITRTGQLYAEALERDRVNDIAKGNVDPETGRLTPQGWEQQRQVIAGGFGPADIGATGQLGTIKAYHGSPHAFERFDMSKIGTGEGNQAFGHGLYFAENEGIAQGYRDKLAPPPMPGPHPELVAAQQAYYDVANKGLPVAGSDAEFQAAMQERQAAYDNLMQKNQLQPITAPSPGHLYEVNLNVEPDQMLHWDKPVPADHPVRDMIFNASDPHVNSVYADMRNAGKDARIAARNDNLTGEGAHYQLSKLMGGPAEAATALREAGIPGISYLDAGSRGAGQGTLNHVMFDDATIDILRKSGIAGLVGGGAAATAAGGNTGDNQ
jgi:hypothetical protein